MTSEYALDPALVAQWHDPKEWAFYREAFADDRGRCGSTFPRQNPKKWRQYVFQQFRELVPDATPDSMSWQRLGVVLERLSEHMVERTPPEAAGPSWLATAVQTHRVRPFDGILSTVPDAIVAEVLTPEMLFDARPPSAWTVPPCPPVARTAEEFAQALRPLLTRCREAVFVDPWFDPREARFVEPLRAMLKELSGQRSCVASPEAQLVLAAGEGRRNRDAAWLMGLCEQRLPRHLPREHCLEVTVLRQREGKEKIHNRYVLTLLAGVSFGTGLDVADEPETEQTDDICRLSQDQLRKRWGQYVSARGSYFDIAAGPTKIAAP
jgi:hypothetical protein